MQMLKAPHRTAFPFGFPRRVAAFKHVSQSLVQEGHLPETPQSSEAGLVR